LIESDFLPASTTRLTRQHDPSFRAGENVSVGQWSTSMAMVLVEAVATLTHS
jgi:hypothetical protein